MNILNQGFDHVEFFVENVAKHEVKWLKMGFEKTADVNVPTNGARHIVMSQGLIRIILTEYDGSPAAQNRLGYKFQTTHGDGIGVLAIEVDDAVAAFKETTARGGRPATEPKTFECLEGTVTIAEIYTPEDVRYRFVTRKHKGIKNPAPLIEGVIVKRLESPSPSGLSIIDHLTNNIDMGQIKVWTKYYEDVFNFKSARTFHIKTGRTGLNSEVMQSQCGRIKVPINEATEKESQVQEFCDRFKGAGVQHLALLSADIVHSLKKYREEGFKFLTVPSTYYEVVPKRVPGVEEDLKELEELGILLDGEGGGYLMQIFSEEMVGPFFLEFIQRKGNNGFGEGNFTALFEAIERDQIRRGVLKA
ncbi:MAG: 4-hydroxyphenylpyruvate dioxygenase [Bdellovibrionales bacterium]|nr:4-hydroxyphenylpyruvate dioxygenase [Bdellovibrionales bacterium]